MEEFELKTISKVVNEKERKSRHVSLPQGASQKPILKHLHSHVEHRLQIPVIPVVEIRETDPKRPKRTESARSHHSRTGLSNSRKYKSELSLNRNSYENNAYESETVEGDRVSKRSFDNRSNYSNTSSRGNSSLRSLEIQREQYCCKSKWSPCERKLVAVVGVLATIILILVIAMGFSMGGGSTEADHKKFNYFWKL